MFSVIRNLLRATIEHFRIDTLIISFSSCFSNTKSKPNAYYLVNWLLLIFISLFSDGVEINFTNLDLAFDFNGKWNFIEALAKK